MKAEKAYQEALINLYGLRTDSFAILMNYEQRGRAGGLPDAFTVKLKQLVEAGEYFRARIMSFITRMPASKSRSSSAIRRPDGLKNGSFLRAFSAVKLSFARILRFKRCSKPRFYAILNPFIIRIWGDFMRKSRHLALVLLLSLCWGFCRCAARTRRAKRLTISNWNFAEVFVYSFKDSNGDGSGT